LNDLQTLHGHFRVTFPALLIDSGRNDQSEPPFPAALLLGCAQRVAAVPARVKASGILKIVGPLTINNFFPLQDLGRKDASKVLILDMEETPFLDSAALGSIIGIHVSSEKAGRKYALVNMKERLRTLFSMTGVNELLVVYPTIAEAEAALG